LARGYAVIEVERSDIHPSQFEKLMGFEGLNPSYVLRPMPGAPPKKALP
jgi:hypothetical protein